MKVSVIVSTYGRPAYLAKCMESLLRQRRAPEEIILVAQSDDTATCKMLEKYRTGASGPSVIILIEAARYGIVHAENQGLKAATGDIVCFLDDDALAPDNWIADIVRHYERDPSIGGVGGPVIPVVDGDPIIEYTDIFSKMTWLGRRITNTTKIPEKIQEVDLLRGANMSFRRNLVRGFDENLLPYWRRFEDSACLSVKKKGYKLICDPALKILHFEAATQAGPGRDDTPQTIMGLHHNSVYVKLKYLRGFRKIAALFYEFIWGDVTSPGFFQLLAYGVKHPAWRSFSRLSSAMAGKTKGIITYLRVILSRKEDSP
jgi:GT2 family glycosyltransferase